MLTAFNTSTGYTVCHIKLISPPNKLSHLGVGTSWNVWLLSIQYNGHDDCNRQHVMKRHTATHHLIQDHAKTVHISWKLVASIVQDLWSCPMYCANIAWVGGGGEEGGEEGEKREIKGEKKGRGRGEEGKRR